MLKNEEKTIDTILNLWVYETLKRLIIFRPGKCVNKNSHVLLEVTWTNTAILKIILQGSNELKCAYVLPEIPHLKIWVPYFSDYKMHFPPPPIWEGKNGGASYSPNVAYLARWGVGGWRWSGVTGGGSRSTFFASNLFLLFSSSTT